MFGVLVERYEDSMVPADKLWLNGNSLEGNAPKEDSENELDIILNNVVCNFSVRCHLNLKQIAMNGNNVEFHKEMAMLIMKLRRPRCTASIWSSGKITMTGATTEDDAKVGARRCARVLQKLGFNVKFTNYRVVNVLATCTMPFAIKVADFATAHPRLASYEPELHPGCTYKLKDIKATLKIFSTGSITITAPCVNNIQIAVEEAYRLVYEYKNERRMEDIEQFPINERKRRRLEERLLKEKQRNGTKNNNTKAGKSKSQWKAPPRKKSRLDRYDEAEDEEEEVIQEEDTEQADIEAIINLKTPIEEDETEDEEEASFDSAASHD